jgi:CBS domain containing-hemolysin-like protein
VAGLVTIEDLLEQIVGEIRDEHETEAPREDPQREPDGAWVVSGSFPVDQLGPLFGDGFEVGNGFEATTVGGLVSEIEGRIPLPGEMVVLDHAGLRMEVVASTDRRVERVRVYPPAAESAREDRQAEGRPAEGRES